MKYDYQYCPVCGDDLKTSDEHKHCPQCKWSHYDNPVPVVTVLASTFGERSRSIIMVKRGIPPFKGGWCLPCGYINRHEIPKVAACREMKEETGLVVRLEKILCICNPMPGEINQITISYLGRIAEGSLKAGDDAEDVQIFRKENCPTPCFRSHKMLVDKWWDGRLGEITCVDLD